MKEIRSIKLISLFSLFIFPSLGALSSDTGFVFLEGVTTSTLNETHILTKDQYNQKVWIPRDIFKKLNISLKENQPFYLEIHESKIKFEKNK